MTVHACILGIDGSGKTSTSRAVTLLLASRHGLVSACAGESFGIATPAVPELLRPEWLPFSAPLSSRAKRMAKRLVNNRILYPPFKLTQMLLQDSAAWRLGKHLKADVVVSDGNLVLSTSGRVGNYTRAASLGRDRKRPIPDAEDLAALFACLCEGTPLPAATKAKFPILGAARMLLAALRAIRLRPAWLPDLVVFLDVTPEVALSRIGSRGLAVDAHENKADLTQARAGYLNALGAFARYRQRDDAVLLLETSRLSPDEVAGRIATFVARGAS